MPRPKSELTKQANLGIRLSFKQKEMFQDIGGVEWLRKYLDRQIRSEEIQLGLSPRGSLLENLKGSSEKK